MQGLHGVVFHTGFIGPEFVSYALFGLLFETCDGNSPAIDICSRDVLDATTLRVLEGDELERVETVCRGA